MDHDGSTPSRRLYHVHAPPPDGNPYPHYAWFRSHDPVHVGQPGWPLGRPQVLLFRYADVAQWLKDPRMIRDFTTFPEVQAYRKLHRWEPPGPETFDAVTRQFMLFQDPPGHTRLRRVAGRTFAAHLGTDRRPEIEQIMTGLLAAFRDEQDGEGDLIQRVAYPLPMMVTASFLGIPREDLHYVRTWSSMIGETADTPAAALADAQARVNEVTHELSEYVRALVNRRSGQPEDDYISRLIAARDDDGGRLSEDELVAMCLLMISAGHQTMVNVIANGTLALMRHRDQWDRLVADPSLAAGTVEEIIRYDSPTQFIARIAAEDIEISGVPVPRGTEVLFMLGSANRDEAVWDDPDVLRVDRKGARHIGFASGIHTCMGAPLARMEAAVAFRTLARDAPGLHLTEPEPRWRPVLHGLERLDVRLQS